MSLLTKNEPLKIFDFFKQQLPKKEATFLIGYYYFNNNVLLNNKEQIQKFIIIGQQYLTLCTKNNYIFDDYKNIKKDSKELILEEKDIYDSLYDKINQSINSNYELDATVEFNLDNIKFCINPINEVLDEKIILQIKTEPIKKDPLPKVEIVIPSNSYTPKVQKTTSTKKNEEFHKSNIAYAKECIDIFCSSLPKHSNIIDLDKYGLAKDYFYTKGHMITISNPNIEKSKFIEYVMKDDEKKFDGVWCNNSLKNETGEKLKKQIYNLSTLIKQKGYIFLSFPYGEKNIIWENTDISRFTEDTFYTYFDKCQFNKLRIEKIWKDSFRGSKKNKNTINIILQKANKIININNQTNKLPQSIDIKKFSLICVTNPLIPGPNSEISQKLLISNEGPINFEYGNFDLTKELSKYDKTEQCSKDSCQEIFFKTYRTLLQEELPKEKEKNYWEIELTEVSGDLYTAFGNLNDTPSQSLIDLSNFIRNKTKIDNLWGFEKV